MPGTKKPKTEPEFQCGYCSKAFLSERSLVIHSCVRKTRELEKDEKQVRLGLNIYLRFYEKNTNAKSKTWDDFARSSHYNEFVKVARYLIDINAVNTTKFVEELITSGLPIKDWRNPAVYEAYLRRLLRDETPGAAIERNILLMQQWAVETGNEWQEFFAKIATFQAVAWMRSGRISPWLIYISPASDQMMSRFTPEQWSMIETYLDPAFWEIKMERHKEEVEFFKKTLAEFNL